MKLWFSYRYSYYPYLTISHCCFTKLFQTFVLRKKNKKKNLSMPLSALLEIPYPQTNTLIIFKHISICKIQQMIHKAGFQTWIQIYTPKDDSLPFELLFRPRTTVFALKKGPGKVPELPQHAAQLVTSNTFLLLQLVTDYASIYMIFQELMYILKSIE